MTEYREPKLRRMLSSLPLSRMVVVISYGYIGRSQRQASTANASGLDTARFVILTSGHRLLDSEYSKWSALSRVLCRELKRGSSDREGAEEDRLHRRRRRRRPELLLQAGGRFADQRIQVGRPPAQLVGDRVAEDQPVGETGPGFDGRRVRHDVDADQPESG